MVTNEEDQLTLAQDSIWWCWGGDHTWTSRPGVEQGDGMGVGTVLRSLPKAIARQAGQQWGVNCPEDEPQLSRLDIGGYGWLVRAQIQRRMIVFLGAGPANLLRVWRSLLQC